MQEYQKQPIMTELPVVCWLITLNQNTTLPFPALRRFLTIKKLESTMTW